MKTKFFFPFFASLLALVLTSVANGQDYRGKVQGIVTDSNQAAVREAKVTLQNRKTGVSAEQQTDATGRYLFLYVEPGDYAITVEAPGFTKLIQENLLVQARSDVTVNPVLQIEGVQEQVVITDAPPAIQSNSSSVATTLDTKTIANVPNLSRNPFRLATIDPAIRNSDRNGFTKPYESFSSNSLDFGGGTHNQNDILVDSTPVNIGPKTGYVPPTDSVRELVVQQNSVDAEWGNSAGGVVQAVMKSGTNEWHGDGWFLGRRPNYAALADRTVRSRNGIRQNMFGGQLSNPIWKNRLFNYFVLESWDVSSPASIVLTLPTEAMRRGDFSGLRNPDGSLRVIYDPLTSTFDPATGVGTRTPFPGNIIPQQRMDPLALRFLQDIWGPNNPGDNLTGINNFKSDYVSQVNYHNWSNRVDFKVSDNLSVYGRISRFRTTVADNNPTSNNSPAWVSPNGSARHAFAAAFDGVYTINPTTIVNVHVDWPSTFVDSYFNQGQLENGYGQFWSNPWYETYQTKGSPNYYPRLDVGWGNSPGIGQPWVFWDQTPRSKSINAKVSKVLDQHFLKVGFDHRQQVGNSFVQVANKMVFRASMTAGNFITPNTNVSGNDWASFLLGAVDPSSTWYSAPFKEARYRYWSGFAQDDFKITRNLTLNLGLRLEYEVPYTDPENRLGRFLDLTNPIPEMQGANAPQLPAAVLQYRTQPTYTGAYVFADSSHPGMYDGKMIFLPRVGLAYRINERSVFRFGYAKYSVPFAKANSLLDYPAYPGLDVSQTTLAPVLGVPQAFLSDPFAGNALIAPRGSDFGRYWGLGDNLSWTRQDFSPGINDRINFSYQRELPYKFVADVTFFMNFGHDLQYTRQANLLDPNLLFTHKGALSVQVPNPFFQFSTPSIFPGSLRNQRTVSIARLLVPYPHYGNLTVVDYGAKERYKALDLKLQRQFANGFNFLIGYNYNREKSQVFLNEVDQYNNQLTYLDGTNPRQRISVATVVELPFGAGRAYLSNVPRLVDTVLGGWQVNLNYNYSTGEFLRFGAAQVSGDPTLANPTPDRWFDTSKFNLQPAFTPRTNPWQYDGLTGPGFYNLDASMAKTFKLTEKIRFELKGAVYNLTNSLIRANPDVSITSSTFGKALRQRTGYQGRQAELGLKISF